MYYLCSGYCICAGLKVCVCVCLTFLTRVVRSWTKSLRRLCRVWSSRAFRIKGETEKGNSAVQTVTEHLVDQWSLREQSESRRQIMTYNRLLQPFEVLLRLLMSLMEESTDRQKDIVRQIERKFKMKFSLPSYCQNNSWIKNERSMDRLPHSWAVTHLPIWCNTLQRSV